SASRRALTWEVAVRAILLSLLFVVVVSLILVFQLLPTEQVTLEEGDVSPVDIRAPRRTTYVSQILTEEAQAKAEEGVRDAYDPPDARIARQQVTRARQVLNYIDSVRYDAYASLEVRMDWIAAIPDLDLLPAVLSQTLLLSEGDWSEVSDEVVYVIDQVMREEIGEGQLAGAKRALPTKVSLDLSEEEAEIVSELAKNFIKANSFYNKEKTEENRRLARESVEPVTRVLEEGEVVLRAGDIVDSLDLEALDALGLRQAETEWPDIVSAVIFVLAITIILDLYLLRLRSDFLANRRHTFLLFVLIVLFILGAKLTVPGHTLLPYLFPSAALSMLLMVLLGPQLAVAVTIVLSLMVGFMAGGSLELTTYALVGSLIAALSLWRAESLNAFLRAGIYAILANMAVILAFRLPDQKSDLLGMVQLVLASVSNGGLSAILTLGGFFLLGSVFDITTPLRLMELARPTHPLLRQLLLKAPGTYHHSLLVSNMAEQAAEQIEADALLARVGAYYHDIGKTVRPYFFVENQADGINVHDRLDPKTSAQIILSHTKDGLELARKYRLPGKIQEFIAQHHGAGRVSYFYEQARQQEGDAGTVDEDDFCYRGPRPRSREVAIVMLADGCESAVRSARPTSSEGIDELVRKVINDRLLRGELDDSDLTLRDLDKIREAFTSILQGVFHPRIKYPEGALKELEPAAQEGN
ncbi:MAG: HDIG domain-containing protein, partial [Anaerolineae bacterium]|nr:HDIG domain-containing protein [Anaerolineae bacterium]